MKLTQVIWIGIFAFCLSSAAQAQTFLDRRVINTHSVETLKKRQLDFRVGHRFGDMFGDAGGWPTFYGLENASDILIGFEYGLSDRFNIGISRTSGAGLLRRLINTTFKVKLMDQFGTNPKFATITLVAVTSVSTTEANPTEEAIDHFDNFLHRWSYTSQLLVARQLSDRFSLQIQGGYQHRNVVLLNDQNGIFFAGIAARLRLSKSFALIFDGNYTFSELRTTENGYYPALGIGLEWNTNGGHNFQLNFTNARGLIENDFIPYTQSDWSEGQFRLGFTISRIFRL